MSTLISGITRPICQSIGLALSASAILFTFGCSGDSASLSHQVLSAGETRDARITFALNRDIMISEHGDSPFQPNREVSCRALTGDTFTVSKNGLINLGSNQVFETVESYERSEAKDEGSNREGVVRCSKLFFESRLTVHGEARKKGKETRETLRFKVLGAALNVTESKESAPGPLRAPVGQTEDLAQQTSDIQEQDTAVCGLQYPVKKEDYVILPGGMPGAPRSYPGGHTGVDFSAREGVPIFAAASGTTYRVDNDPRISPYGKQVFIKHPRCDSRFHFATIYSHTSVNVVTTANTWVTLGQLIAKVGETGSASKGAHLHFDALNLHNGLTSQGSYTALNPLAWLNKGHPR